jgi:hypothetical protein
MHLIAPTKCRGDFRLPLKCLQAEGGMQAFFPVSKEDSSIDESSLLTFAVSISLKP